MKSLYSKEELIELPEGATLRYGDRGRIVYWANDGGGPFHTDVLSGKSVPEGYYELISLPVEKAV